MKNMNSTANKTTTQLIREAAEKIRDQRDAEILEVLGDGQLHTAHDISRKTGIPVATIAASVGFANSNRNGGYGWGKAPIAYVPREVKMTYVNRDDPDDVIVINKVVGFYKAR